MEINKEKVVCSKKIWHVKAGPIKEILPTCRQMAAEGSVLLKNEGVLPFKKDEKIAVFGRLQTTYYKSGTGSGGSVNIEKKPCILESLKNDGTVIIDEILEKTYSSWIEEHPFDNGHGWATEPWCQEEMPLDASVAEEAAGRNDAAVVIVGRSSGEDHDNKDASGSYRLSENEELMIKNVSKFFKRFVVVLNVGNIIDLSFEEKYNVPAILYVWQGGMEGANALSDMLCGKISPTGKLSDTQAYKIEDYPSNNNFGDKEENIYAEDIFVGYRYFETFAPEKVKYPFGFGLTYTSFALKFNAENTGDKIVVHANVKNIGNFRAKEVVQIYYSAPCGLLGTPSKQLAAYRKTKELAPNESENIDIIFNISDMASFDDSGVTGYKNAYVLEKGDYAVYAGNSVRDAQEIFNFNQEETKIVSQLEEAMAPKKVFERFSAVEENGKRVLKLQNAPIAQIDTEKRIHENRPAEIPFSGNMGIKLKDVYEGKNTLDEFLAQLTDKDMSILVLGEGMSSPKVTAGIAGAFGGVCESLLDFGIPVLGVSDGPSGIRLDSGEKATSIPTGTLLACSWNDCLVQKLHEYMGIELFSYDIDSLLGPGMNIHRHPLNGRNFEYFSEDPLLTGKIAAAAVRGIAATGCSATIKHFCCNNQETSRSFGEAVVSQRALREIYLKGYEIAVKEGGAMSIMTSYTPVNGYWCASNYDLTTTILRNEWGFKGLVMTDWWAKANNCFGETCYKYNVKATVRSQNDLYMLSGDPENESNNNVLQGLEEGYITRGELQRCAKNILAYILQSVTFAKFYDGGCVKPDFNNIDDSKLTTVFKVDNVQRGKSYKVKFGGENETVYKFKIQYDAPDIAQTSVKFITDYSGFYLTVNGTGKNAVEYKRKSHYVLKEYSVSIEFGEGVTVTDFEIKC